MYTFKLLSLAVPLLFTSALASGLDHRDEYSYDSTDSSSVSTDDSLDSNVRLAFSHELSFADEFRENFDYDWLVNEGDCAKFDAVVKRLDELWWAYNEGFDIAAIAEGQESLEAQNLLKEARVLAEEAIDQEENGFRKKYKAMRRRFKRVKDIATLEKDIENLRKEKYGTGYEEENRKAEDYNRRILMESVVALRKSQQKSGSQTQK